MSVAVYEPLALNLSLPWHDDKAQEDKFKRYVKWAVVAFTLFILVVQFLPTFDLSSSEENQIVKTTVILEPREVPKIEETPVPIPEKPKPIAQPKPKPKKPAVAKTKSKPKPVPKAKKESVVSSQGLDKLSSSLSALTSGLDIQKLRQKNVTNSDLGKVAKTSRSTLGKEQVTQRSGGVVIDDSVMNTDMSVLSDHESSDVKGLDFSVGIASTVDSHGSLRQGVRDMESIRRTFESAKSRVFSIYYRALSDASDLAGEFVFELIIEPDGKVSDLKIVSSELGAPELEAKILAQIKRVNFGVADVVASAVKYKFVFVPG